LLKKIKCYLVPMNIGWQEWALIFAVIFLVFGPKRLLELARSLGRSIGEFQKGLQESKKPVKKKTKKKPRKVKKSREKLKG